MHQLPFDAKVTCTDGRAGTSVAVTLQPLTRVISYLIVADDHGYERMVPVTTIAKTADDEIWLDCTEDQFKDLELFRVTEFVNRAPQKSGDWAEDEGEWEDAVDVSQFERTDPGMPVQVERVPQGEVAFRRKTDIEATDGHVGEVDQFMITADTGQITHLVLHKGHLWGKKNIMIPLSAVESIDYDSVYLNVDKDAVDSFPEQPK